MVFLLVQQYKPPRARRAEVLQSAGATYPWTAQEAWIQPRRYDFVRVLGSALAADRSGQTHHSPHAPTHLRCVQDADGPRRTRLGHRSLQGLKPPEIVPMYRFKSGQFEGRSMEQVILRYAPGLYRMASWAEDKSHLRPLLKEFRRLRQEMGEAPILVHCSEPGCKRTPKRMTLPLGPDRYYWPDPYFWCGKHSPWEDEGISPKLPIHLDTISSFEEKKNRSAVHKSVLRAYGINRKPSAITETFAGRFFANLR